MSPFENIDGAFAPMIDEYVAIVGYDNALIPCSIMDDITGDPIFDNAADAERKDIVITFRQEDYATTADLRVGDRFTRCATGARYSITSKAVDAVNRMITIHARSC